MNRFIKTSIAFAIAFVAANIGFGQIKEWSATRAAVPSANVSALTVAPDGSAYLATWAQTSVSVKTTTLSRYTSAGLLSWEKVLPANQLVDGMTTDGAGNLYVIGSQSAGTVEWVERRHAANGNIGWTHTHALNVPVLYDGAVGRTYLVYESSTDTLTTLSGDQVERLTCFDGSRAWITTLPLVEPFLQVVGANSRLAIASSGRVYAYLMETGSDPDTAVALDAHEYFGIGANGTYSRYTNVSYSTYESPANYRAAFGAGAFFFGMDYWGQGQQHTYADVYGPNGEHTWEYVSSGSPFGVFFVGVDMIRFMSGGTMRRTTLAGQDLWSAPGGFSTARLDEGLLGTRLVTISGGLSTLDYATGQKLWTFTPSGTTFRAIQTLDKRVYAASTVGADVVLTRVAQGSLDIPASIPVGATQATIELDFAAPQAGLLFSLQSDDPAVTVPATAFISGGGTSVQFQVDAGLAAAGHAFTIRAVLGDGTILASSTVKPVHVLSIQSANPASGVTLGATTDVNGAGQGTTPFQRTYAEGAHVAVSVGNGLIAGNKLFDHFEVDGAPISGPLVMDADHTITAVYVQGYQLSVQSSNPSTGVPMTVWTPDYFNRGNGSTSFNRLYKSGVTAKVTAPAQVGSTIFHHWEKDGSIVAGNAKTIQVPMAANHTIKAVYVSVYPVTVTSTNPGSGVPITVWTADVNAQRNGSTSFVRNYASGTTASMTAPASVGINRFFRWEIDGVAQPTGVKTVSVVVSAARTLKATYVQCFTLTVQSGNPSSGVPITVSKVDNQGQKDGTTSFTRQYDQSASVTLTAPASHNGHAFKRWLKNGVPLTFNRITTVLMDANHSYVAEYLP